MQSSKDLKFYNIYIQSEYSFLSSTCSLKDLKRLGEDALSYGAFGLCDEAMYGSYKFYKLMKGLGVLPILGLKCKVNSDLGSTYLLLYAKNNDGYKNLLRISSMLAIDNKKVTLEYLKEYSNGIICVIPYLENELVKYYQFGDYENINRIYREYNNTFNEIYLGVSLQTIELKENANKIIEDAKRRNILSIALHKVNLFKKNDLDAYATLRCIDLQKPVGEYDLSELERNSYLLNNKEGLELYKDYPELIVNLNNFVSEINVTIENKGYKFPTSGYENPKEYLENLCKFGLNKRLESKKNLSGELVNVYKNRLLSELDVINSMGFSDYFLIVYDYIRFAKKSGIYVGPGRGSSGGSLVSYTLGIIDIDPIEYDLLFERFLNKERLNMPDIDTDFEDERRDEVIKYICDKYGQTRVAHIVTFGTLKPRLAIRDVVKALELKETKIKEIMRYIPDSGSRLSMDQILQNSPILSKMRDQDEEVGRVIDLVLRIEDFPRNISTHASAIIMADTDLYDYTPLVGYNDVYQTQYEASDLEELGLVKMDILGINNLTIIKNTVNEIKKNNPDFDYNNILFDDKEVFKMFASGNTSGIFQFDSPGVTRVLMNLKTSSIDDVIAATSLFRPGPMEIIPSYIDCKFGKKKIDYFDPCLEEILKPTFGHIVYQEQVMRIANVFAGYSLGEADLLRRAISKKKVSLIEEERTRFIDKAVSLGRDKAIAKKLYEYIAKFGDYGFNKSHAVAYSVVAYKMAYLKCHYYNIFMSSMLSNVIGDSVKTSKYINECKLRGIKVLPPMINYAQNYYLPYEKEKDGKKEEYIIYPLTGLREIGSVLFNKIDEERSNGPFESYEDFVNRTKGFINKKLVANLIYAGCFDDTSCNKEKMSKMDMIMSYDEIASLANYDGLFKTKVKSKIYQEYTFEEISYLEKEVLGFNLKYDLFIKYLPYKEKYKTINLDKLKMGENITLFAIRSFKEIKTKKGEDMAFLTVYDDTFGIEVVVFPDVYRNIKGTINNGNVCIAKINVTNNKNGNDKLSYICNNLHILNTKN